MPTLNIFINAFIPLVFVSDELDKLYRDYFIRVMTASIGISITFIFLTSLVGLEVPPRWLMIMMLLWFPIGYSMHPRMQRAQKEYDELPSPRKHTKFNAGIVTALLAMWIMARSTHQDYQIIDLLSLSLQISYLTAIWNQTLLSFLLDGKFFDRGGIIAAILAIIGGVVWAIVENT